MRDTITIKIPGKPISKQRPRFYRRGKHVGTYNAQETEEGMWLAMCREQLPLKPLTGALSVVMLFSLQRPKSHYGTGRNSEKLKPSAPHYPSKHPDIDNFLKFAMDCLNEIAWVDDSQVVSILGEKTYAAGQGYTTIHIRLLIL